ncbi:MAG: dihydrolipoamide acyltransferase [Gemmatimonadetes bacterium]|nr:MAG: dihydrolipoamide acyltransferase [Gemmatimonadota bacterium]
MATTVFMEALSPTMEEGRLVKWHKHEGDAVKAGDTLAEVETDKAIMDLQARADGILRQVSAAEGQTVPVGKELAVIVAPGEPLGAGRGTGDEGRVAPSPAATAPAPSPAPRHSPPAAAAADAAPVKASPLARRMAKESGVDLKLLTGSGPGGRVVRRDLETAAARPAATVSASAPVAPVPPPPSPVPVSRTDASYEDVPLTQIRKTIAKRLAASLGPVPHYFLTTEVDMERAAEAREALNRDLGDEGRISFNDIVVKAAALALTRHRACNAWFQDDHIRYWNEVHVGVAVAVEDGLITPVIRHADRKSLREIGREAHDLAQRARNRRLRPEEYTGSTFSVSNLGMFDIDQFTAVINPPEAAILAVGSVTQKPVVADGTIVARRRMRLTLGCDHRVIDGATGAVFLQTLKQMLENPLAMLL